MKRLSILFMCLAMAFGHFAIAAPSFEPYTQATFNTAIQNHTTIVVHVYASWCPICQRQLPGLNTALAEPELANVRAIRVDYDTDRDFLMAHRIPNQSVILVFRDGQEVLRLNGVTNAEQIKSKLKAAL